MPRPRPDGAGRLTDRNRSLGRTRRITEDLASRIPVGVYVIRTAPGAEPLFSYVSPRFCELLGLDRDSILSHSAPLSLLPHHPEDADSFFSERKQATEEVRPFVWEGRFLVGDTVRWLRFDSSPTIEEGKEITWSGVLIDITERKKSEIEYRGILKATRDGFWINDLQGRFLEVNDAYCELIGYRREELLGMSIDQVEAVESAADIQCRRERILSSGSDRFETLHRRKDGRTIALEVSINYLSIPVPRFIVLLRDISERKQAEAALLEAKKAAEAASRAKSLFLANMSHEIRTPMNAIIGLTRLVLDTELNPRQKSYLMKSYDASRALLGVLNDILDYSKIEAGRLEITPAPFLIETVLREAVELFAAQIDHKGLDLLLEIAPDVPSQVVGDAMRVGQVLNNLLGNAVKFTEEGEIHVRIDCVPRDGDSLSLRFAVRDTGIGLSREESARIFNSFTQADQSITRKFGGTGLGLAICKTLVELMGGEIRASGAEGKGALFTFSIQVRRAGDAPLPSPLPSRRVLVVDDSRSWRGVLQRVLDGWGMASETAASGEECLDAVRRASNQGKPFELLLVDWRMPGMNGLELAGRLEEESGEALMPRPAIIMMSTAYEREQLLSEEGSAALDGFLTKPLLPSRLREILRSPVPKSAPTSSPGCSPMLSLAGSLGGLRILLVEDSFISREVALDYLERMGADVTGAANGKEAETLAATGEFDAVLMDLHMPEMDGFEAARKITKLLPGLPVIAMTAAVMPRDREKCSEAGMVDFIAKPFEPEELLTVLSRWTAGSGPVREAPAGAPAPARTCFDPQRSLDRLGGNGELLRRLLRRFAEEKQGALARVAELLATADRAGAAAILHELKGTAANLVLAPLADEAARTERKLKEGGNPVSLDSLSSVLEETLAELHRYLLSSAADGTVAGEQAELLDLLERIVPFVREGELVPDALLQGLQRLADADLPGNPLAELLRRLDRFDHQGALEAVRQIQRQVAP